MLDLILTIQRDEYGIAITAQDQPDLSDIPAFYQSGTGDFWVAQDDGRLVGTIALRDIGAGQAALRKMFVVASHRGRSAGVAQALLDTLMTEARDRGVAQIWLGTTDRFLAAHRFYEKNGFGLVQPEALPDRFPRMAVDSRFYGLRIG
ncbi:GNAT family N-acetyltransferase [Sphingobium sp. WCS2017Hpa-17]|uniref:GNAT family N-acetyltransferase n=1 Tax=Sphingobium sp. WCS2017Hpa-17 TaxID=3073638 RepID=UPI00288C5AE3|nr:GNAT family N-acetyltransferase [Sphingobium sp. WCS2017Hpa-17]